MKRIVGSLIAFALVLGGLALGSGLTDANHPISGDGSVPLDGEALLTIVNPEPSGRTVTVRAGATPDVGAVQTALNVPTLDAHTVILPAGPEPTEYHVDCGACRPVVLAVADGQRALVVLVPSNRSPVRGDIRVVNESVQRLRGAVRTGATAGTGRILVPFDLAPGASADVGVRLPVDQRFDLNITCDTGCAPRVARAANGVDLEIVLP